VVSTHPLFLVDRLTPSPHGRVRALTQVILIRLFGLAPAVPLLLQPGEPLLIYERVPGEAKELYAENPEERPALEATRGPLSPNSA
jgi:hypothetical protein